MSTNTVANTVATAYLRDRLVAMHGIPGGVPSVDLTNMDKTARKRIERMRKARDNYVAGCSLEGASKTAGVSARRYQRIMTRYLALADDGRIGGERVFQAHWRPHVHPVRVEPLNPEKAGTWGAMTGLFRKLMTDNKDLRIDLVKALRRKGKAALQVNRLVGRELGKLLERLCIAHGVEESAYPRCTKDGGLRALRRWIVSDFLPLYASDWISAESGSKPLTPGAAEAFVLKPTVVEYEPYADWVLDEVKLDARVAMEMLNARGDIDLVEHERISAIRLIELGYNTTLAYYIVLGRQATAEDVGNLLWRALNGWTMKEVLPGLKIEPGGGFPVLVMPELMWRKPRRILADNAFAHLAAVLGVIVELTLGADLKFGNPASPLERAEIEAKFALAARRLFHQLPGTTGTGPLDPQRKRHAHLGPQHLLRADELEHAYGVMMANENGAVSSAAKGIPALERLRRALVRGAIKAPVPLSNRVRHMFFHAKKVCVHAKPDDERRPYVNYDRIRYTSTELQRRYDLNGKYVYARADQDDLRVIILYDERGSEICRAHGEGRWGLIPHDRRMRTMALRNVDKGAFETMPQDGPLLALFARLQRDAASQPSAALQLAHCLAVLGRHFQGETIDVAWLGHLLSTGSTLDAMAYVQPAANSPVMAPAAAAPLAVRATPAVPAAPAETMAPRNAIRRAT